MPQLALNQTLRLLLLFILSFIILYYASTVLIPLTFGGVLAMVLIPVSRWFESKGVHRGVSSFLSILLFILLIAGIILLLQWQIGDLVKDFSKIEQQVKGLVEQVKDYVDDKFGISPRQQQKMISEQQSGGMEKAAGVAAGTILSMFSLMVDLILVLVYVFLFMFFRSHFKNFILRVVPVEHSTTAIKTMTQVTQVTQQYITGLSMMIACLWVMYGIGFSIVGIKNAIFFAILCGILEIVPFAGNITGTAITMLIAFAQGGDSNLVLGVLITYAIVQFLQTYVLEPLVVGNQININPLFTILIIVVGEAVWGIPGMVLALPLLGMLKVICNNVEALKPYGYLIGSQNAKEGTSWFKKLLGKKED